MSALIIDGKRAALKIRDEIREKVEALTSKGIRAPKLAVVLVGNNPASEIYVTNKEKACHYSGIQSQTIRLPLETTEEEIIKTIGALNAQEDIDGILLQLPLPKHCSAIRCVSAIDPKKDVDGITPYNEGLLVWRQKGLYPCTPLGILHLIKTVVPDMAGKVAAVVGRSALVGMPIGTLLEGTGCTLIGLHSESIDCASWTKQADIVVVAAGVHRLVGKDWIRKGAVVIDVGIHRVGNKVEGDVIFDEVSKIASAISPVPGGVGPMTIAMLVSNVMTAFEARVLNEVPSNRDTSPQNTVCSRN